LADRFVTAMAFSAVPTPLYPLYQALDGFSTITIVFAVYVVGVLISLMLAGQLSDVIGRKRVLVAALILELAGAAFAVTRRLRAMGIRDKPISPGSPWQNCFAERLIGTIRRECVDHVVAFGEQHLRQVVKSYAGYYNTARTHRSLDKDPPVSRPVQRIGRIVSHAMVGGLHHQYVRI
jgi:transposase InsO family protein